MSTIARELDETLKTLDTATAAGVERLVREALELAVGPRRPAPRTVALWPPGFFEETSGAFANEPFERPPQGEFEQREAW